MRLLFCLMIIVVVYSCNSNKNTPDVSGINVPLKVERFEKDFFALDTNNITAGLEKLSAKYPNFDKLFLIDILGIDPRWSNDSIADYVKLFMNYGKTMYDTSNYYFNEFSKYESQIKTGLQYVKYYYPTYKIPTKIISFIGPADGAADGIGSNFLTVGLHAHLGANFALYKTTFIQETYPAYITANFGPEYIAVNCMKNIVADMYPDTLDDKRLLIQMIEKGKRLYLLSKFLPVEKEHKLIGYTAAQMKDCYAHERVIWDLFVQNNFLQTADINLIKNYVTEGPKTQELGDNAPGNIGSFAGWQIVKKYASKYPDIKPDSLMRIDDEKIYETAKYKP